MLELKDILGRTYVLEPSIRDCLRGQLARGELRVRMY